VLVLRLLVFRFRTVSFPPLLSLHAASPTTTGALLDALPAVRVPRRVGPPPLLHAKCGSNLAVLPSRPPFSSSQLLILTSHLILTTRPVGCPLRQMPPSRQARRRAERVAAKRAPADVAAAGSAGAAAALAKINVHPLGGWETQVQDPSVGPRGCCRARHVTSHRMPVTSARHASACMRRHQASALAPVNQ
jgi:hypothetical protein